MKQVFTTMLFLFVAQCGWSQLDMKLKPRFPVQDTDSVVVGRDGGVTVWKNLAPLRYVAIPHSDSSRFSHSVTAGSVYTLPQDNMPCLKPRTDLVYNMPVQTMPGSDKMPNAYQQQQPPNELLQSLRKQFQKDKK